MTEATQDVTRDRAYRIFSYLRELAKRKSKTVRNILEYESTIWFHEIPEHKRCYSILSPSDDEISDDIWIEVRKPTKEPKRPQCPQQCQKWIDGELDNPDHEPVLLGIVSGDSDDTEIELLEDNPEVRDACNSLLNEWRTWADQWREWHSVHSLYLRLFNIHQQLEKLGEQYELLLCLGLLIWHTPNNQFIKRHLVAGQANINFDMSRAKIEVRGSPEGVRLHFETEMVDANYLPSLERLGSFDQQLEEIQEIPWDKPAIPTILRSWIHSISPLGEYSDSIFDSQEFSDAPTVVYAPAIVLRKRTQRSQVQFFDAIARDFSNDKVLLPEGVRKLCNPPSDRPETDYDLGDLDDTRDTGSQAHYLPLPTNEEQEQIINKISKRSGILVPGPPGIGKSHTIANLICHLLATNKRVLITSQTPRALRVLKEKIPKEIQPLCVSLLGNDQKALQELQGAVISINDRYANWNPENSKHNIEVLETKLYELEKERADLGRMLRESREILTYQHAICDGAIKGTARQIAEIITQQENDCSWLKDDPTEDIPCPLNNEEMAEYLGLLRMISDDYRRELEFSISLIGHGGHCHLFVPYSSLLVGISN